MQFKQLNNSWMIVFALYLTYSLSLVFGANPKHVISSEISNFLKGYLELCKADVFKNTKLLELYKNIRCVV